MLDFATLVTHPRPMHRASRPLRAFAALAFLLIAPATLAAGPTLDRVRSTGVVRFAYRDHAPPFSFAERDGRARGYSVELCERVAAELGKALSIPVKAEWRAVDAATRFDVVAGGEVDAECGTSTVTLSRMEKVDFSLPIFVDGGTVLVRANANLRRLRDLKGRRIAVIAATTTEEALTKELAAVNTAVTLVRVKDADEGLAQLRDGKVDGYAGDRIVLTTLRQRLPDPSKFGFVERDFSYEPYAIVLRRDDPDFRLAVNRALASLYRSGEIDPIFQRWFASLGQPGPLLHAMFYLNRLPE